MMTIEQFDREQKYQTALSVAVKMFRRRIITIDDYNFIESYLRKKYRPVIGEYIPSE